MTKIYTVIGLMSGTSADGVDASLIQSNGENQIDIISNFYLPYEASVKNDIRNLKERINTPKDLEINKNEIASLTNIITLNHAKAVERIINKNKISNNSIDLIGFHGQTIYHSHQNKVSNQLANPGLLNSLTQTRVVYNFREEDINKGGQGAPLTPIYHKAIYNKINLKDPVVFLNIGGISNLTFMDNLNHMISFDCGPGNCLIDKFIQIKSKGKINFDLDGQMASKGQVNEIILENYLNDSFYNLKPPKTLDVNDFSLSMIRGLSDEDSVCTLTELTARTFVDSLNYLKRLPKKIFLLGGGRKNKFLTNRIKELSKINVENIDQTGFDGDFIESQAFAYIALRTFLKKKNSFPSTTGVAEACVGGNILEPK